MKVNKTYGMPIAPGWLIALDQSDMDRWDPDAIMPKILAAVAHADGTVRANGRPFVSDDMIIDTDPVECIAVLMRFPPGHAWLRGVVWIGLRNEVSELRECLESENVGRFKVVALDPESN